MIDLGADVNHRDANGSTPILVCATFGVATRIMDMLHAQGARPARGRRERVASTPRGRRVVKATDRAGADLDAPNDVGWTPAYGAAYAGHAPQLAWLADHGADVDARCTFGSSPVHVAALYGNAAAMTVLLRAGADFAMRDSLGQTPLYYAEQNAHVKIVELIANERRRRETRRVYKFAGTAAALAVVLVVLDRRHRREAPPRRRVPRPQRKPVPQKKPRRRRRPSASPPPGIVVVSPDSPPPITPPDPAASPPRTASPDLADAAPLPRSPDASSDPRTSPVGALSPTSSRASPVGALSPEGSRVGMSDSASEPSEPSSPTSPRVSPPPSPTAKDGGPTPPPLTAGALTPPLLTAGAPPPPPSLTVPAEFLCPISCEPMIDPVTTLEGHAFERVCIEAWFARGTKRSPVTGAVLASTELVPAHALRNLIEAFRRDHEGLLTPAATPQVPRPDGLAPPPGFDSTGLRPRRPADDAGSPSLLTPDDILPPRPA